ncbi:hypothetical protein FOA52_008817 [Chlamydomonas sp. UWO 241]|nr:hypothetical protein FOA52_008817 [Chlamydomonas sp. UWO 241]
MGCAASVPESTAQVHAASGKTKTGAGGHSKRDSGNGGYTLSNEDDGYVSPRLSGSGSAKPGARRSKVAVLIGCNYPGTQAALAGCVNDVHAVREMLLTHFGFYPQDITVMIDTDPKCVQPTGANIKKQLRDAVASMTDGDELFVHFSGHGTQVPVREPDPEEPDHLDEAICPTDMNLLCDNDLVEIFEPLAELPDVKLTFQADCCHSGTLLDMENCEITGFKKGGPPPPIVANVPAGVPGARGVKTTVNARSLDFNQVFAQLSAEAGHSVDQSNMGQAMHDLFGEDAPHKTKKDGNGPVTGLKSSDVGVLMSGCQSHETSADVRPAGGKPFGAFTNAVTTIVNDHFTSGKAKEYPLTYRNLVLGVREMLARGQFTQSPCLECNPRWPDTPFIRHAKLNK